MLDAASDAPFRFDSELVAYCIVRAARERMLPPEALLAMAMQENGRPGTKKRNSNGSYDLGVMQINTLWLKDRSPLKYYVTENQLAFDVCANIHTAAWIVASHVNAKNDFWRAIAKYHSPGTRRLQIKYVNAVNSRLPTARRMIAASSHYQRYINFFFAQPSAGAYAPPGGASVPAY